MRTRSFPEGARLSVLMAAILLAYALARFINLPPLVLPISLFGISLPFRINFQTLVALVVSAMSASGSIWLISDHPSLRGKPVTWRGSLEYWLLPAMTAFLLSIPLNLVAKSPAWWVVFTVGSFLLVLVFIAEYAVVDGSNLSHPAATRLLAVLSYALFLILSIALRSAAVRLYLIIPAIVFTTALVSLHVLHLQLEGRWETGWAAGTALVIGQVAIGLHYWPLTATRYGLILLGLVYGLNGMTAIIEEHKPFRENLVEPLAVLGATWLIAFVLP